jgi:hypothetical protein
MKVDFVEVLWRSAGVAHRVLHATSDFGGEVDELDDGGRTVCHCETNLNNS